MIKSDKVGQCLQCGKDTKITLDNGKYACKQCLDELALQQQEVMKALTTLYDDEEELLKFLQNCIVLLEIMQYNGHSKVNHCIESLKSFEIVFKAQNDTLLSNFLKEKIDFFNNL